MKILIVEDEYNLADAIQTMLVKERYDTTIVTDGENGLDEALSGIYDLIILDVMLPMVDGFQILSELRENKIQSKVIMLTAKATIDDKMMGFNNGADDYLTKPFHMDELLARVNIQLRKSDNINNGIITVGDISLDIKKLNLSNNKNNLSVDIMGKEFQLLEILMRNANQIVDKELIFNKIWGYDSEAELNTLEAYISFIRKKLKLIKANVQIKAIRNMGYKMEDVHEEIKN